MIKEFFKFAIASIRHRKLRSWLTIIGIVIGVAAIISLISIGQGMQVAITEQLGLLGTDKLIIMPGGAGFMGALGGSARELTDTDIDLINSVRGVEHADGMLFKMGRVSFGSENKYAYIIGFSTDPESAWVLEHLEVNGRYLEEGDRYKAVVGYLYPEALFFKKSVKLGSRIDIEEQTFKVVGTLQKIGNRQDDSQVYIPLDVAREIFNEPTDVGMIYAKVRTGYNPSDAADRIEDAMRDDRNQRKGEEDFSVQTTEQLAEAMKNILGIVQTILVGIAGVALLVGGVGLMNTMYTSVLERTREIGVMKATGAKNSHILAIFLVESGFLGFVGGLVGVLAGIGMAKGAEAYAAYAGYAMIRSAITPSLIAFGLAFSFIIGTISGFLPARQASKLKPADALRYE
jgi:putative ABC transport system permease protein